MPSKPAPDPTAFLPLKPVHFMILLSILDQDRHGYAIVKDIDERTSGSVRLEPGNLYRFVRVLMEQGLVREARNAPARGTDERRRYLSITSLGKAVVRAEADRMKSLVRQVERAHPSRSRP